MKTVIIKEVSNNEFPITVFRFRAGEDCVEPESNLLVDPFEEVLFGWFGDEPVDVSKGIFL